MLEPIINTIEVPCSQEKAFEIFVTEMHAWWPLDKRSMSLHATGKPPKGLAVDPRLGGRIVETDAADNEHHWGTFRSYDPHTRLSMDMHMGLPADNASTVEVSFEALGEDRTRIELAHSNWEAFGDMAEMMRNGYGSGWVLIFEQAYAAACRRAPTV
jgi:hypothetical protein